MKYKVLITTSGVGQRLGELTTHTNKALVRIGKKPIISYIIESYPKDVPLVITTGHFGEHIKEFVTLAYPERSVEFADVDIYEGPGSSLAYSMLQAEKYLHCPFIFHASDTIVEEKIPTPTRNWMGGYKGSDASQYSSWNLIGKDEYTFNEKGAINFDYIHIGLIGVQEHKSFWKHLKTLYTKNPGHSGLNDCRAIVSMIDAGHDFHIVNFKKWFDVGNTQALEHTRKHIGEVFHNLHKVDEAIFIFKDKVIKFFHDHKTASDRAKRQILLKGLVPKHLGYKKYFYSYAYTPGDLYANVVTPKDFRRFLLWAEKNLWIPRKEVSPKKFKEICTDFYLHKTRKRVAQFLSANNLKDTTHVINDEKVPSIETMLSKINFDELSNAEQSQFHGDFILDNIIKTKKGYCLVDWRQHFGGLYEAGDMYYDLAKLNHNLTINHDIIHQNLLEVAADGAVIHCDVHRKENLVQCQKVLIDFINERGYSEKKVELLTAIIWLNMSPLHHHPFNIFLYYFGKLNLWRTIQKYGEK